MISQSSEQAGTTAAMRRVMVLALAIGVVLRLLAVRGELWLDEAWSVLLVQEAGSPLGLVTKVRHDNNHILNSLWLWLVGPGAQPELQRMPSLVFALASIALVWRVVAQARLGWAGAIWLLLCAVSYPAIVVGTEARGYSLAMAATVALFGLALQLRAGPSDRRTALALAVVGTMGSLSHAVFILAFIPVAAWLLLGRGRGRRGWSEPLVWASLALPAAVIAALGLFFYRGITIGGGPQAPYVQVILSALSLGFGGQELVASDPQGAALSAGLGLLVAAIAAAEAFLWLRQDGAVASLVVCIILAPLVAVAIVRPDFILGRYFIISTLFIYLLAAQWLGRLARQGAVGSVLAAALVLGIVIGNLRHSAELVRFGRSHFEEAVSAMITRGDSARTQVRVGGGHQNRNEIRLAHMRLQGRLDREVVLIGEQAGAEPPDFVIEESIERSAEPPPESLTAFGAQYSLKTYYPAPFMSGASLLVYERKAQP